MILVFVLACISFIHSRSTAYAGVYDNAYTYYQKYGGRKVSEKIDDFGGTILKENVMYFDNLEDIYSKFND